MKDLTIKAAVSLILSMFSFTYASAQQPVPADTLHYKTISAGPEYKKSPFYEWLWGRNYRKEWATPVRFPVLILDTLKGGMISYKEGGSNQSKSLHIKTAGDKEYALRSVDKTLTKVIPPIFRNTFLADVAGGEISTSDPYGALGVSMMADAIGVYHTNPQYYYLPAQPKLDTLNKKYGDKVYLLEQRPSGDWSDAANLGSFDDFTETDEMLKKIYKDYNYSVDQEAFVRARLFDMLIADFDRHADQWKWGIWKEGDQKIFVPVPTDRDQAFFKHDGVLLNAAVSGSGMKFLQSYDYKIHNIKAYAFVNRILDRLLTNKMTLAQWQAIAADIQRRLTDNVIEASVRQMPAEIFAMDGNDIIAKMKTRRDHLQEYVKEYYLLMAKESEIVGSKKSEYFQIATNENDQITVSVYKKDEQGQRTGDAFYSRSFDPKETEEIRIYGLSGNDTYLVTGKANTKIKLRVIGGDERDSLINETAGSKKAVQVYDDADNYFGDKKNMKLHLSNDSSIHAYNYNNFLPDKKGFGPHIGFNDADRIFVGIRYQLLIHKWRRPPFAYKQSFDADFSVTQRAPSFTYNGLFPKAVGQWDLVARANYDQVKWLNFFGLGNETLKTDPGTNYYRMRNIDASANLGLSRNFKKSNINFSGFYERVKIHYDKDRLIAKIVSPVIPDIYKPENYAGIQLGYSLVNVKDSVLPQRGFTFSANAKHTEDLNATGKSFQRYSGILQLFIPILPKLSLAVKSGAATISGSPLFYNYPSIGEPYNLRGFPKERFTGRSTFYNNTELRFISNVRTYLFNGKAGLLAFIDNGRVWLPGESSNIFHTSYGGGILVAPFNKISLAVTYAISKEAKMIQLHAGLLF